MNTAKVHVTGAGASSDPRDLHAGARAQACDRPPDTAGPDDQHPLAVDRIGQSVPPSPPCLIRPGLGEQLGEGEDQPEHILRHRTIENPSRVGHRDVALDELAEEQGVDSGAAPVDPLELAGLRPRRFEGLCPEIPAEQDLRFVDRLAKLRVALREVQGCLVFETEKAGNVVYSGRSLYCDHRAHVHYHSKPDGQPRRDPVPPAAKPQAPRGA